MWCLQWQYGPLRDVMFAEGGVRGIMRVGCLGVRWVGDRDIL